MKVVYKIPEISKRDVRLEFTSLNAMLRHSNSCCDVANRQTSKESHSVPNSIFFPCLLRFFCFWLTK